MEIKGYTYGYQGTRGMYCSEEGIASQNALMELGINWVCLAFSVKQQTFSSTEILFDYRRDVTDLDLIRTIQRFHERGIRVCLKPMIDTKDGIWRALINFPDRTMREEDTYWSAWFESYQAYLLHYAELAEYTGCEMLCLGCEMLGTERKESYWRAVIAAVRAIYHGKLTYNTNHGKEEVAQWYDAIDYVGTSAYYPVENAPGASVAEMRTVWESIAEQLEQVSKRIGKPILFMEIGCRSAHGCAQMPWDFMHLELPHDEEEQANFFESSLQVFSERAWFAGYFWWDWSPVIYHTKEEAALDHGFSIHQKKAEKIVKEWYRR